MYKYFWFLGNGNNLYKISYIKELLPEPETPVIATSFRKGISAFKFLMLKIK
jgi:hypothetical protein